MRGERGAEQSATQARLETGAGQTGREEQMKRREQESNGGMLSEDGEMKRVEREEGERAGTMKKREVETEMEEERGGQVW